MSKMLIAWFAVAGLGLVAGMTLVGTPAPTHSVAPPKRLQKVIVSNCSDPVTCDSATCDTTHYDADSCVFVGDKNNIIEASFAVFSCLREPFLCTPTQAFWNDPNCSHPIETLWTPCGTCMQFPPRDMHCVVINNTYHSLVGTCSDATCGGSSCHNDDGTGLKAGVCWPHPGVPGLFLKFPTLEACAAVRVTGFNSSTCDSKSRVAETIMPSQGRCFKGLTFECRDEQQ